MKFSSSDRVSLDYIIGSIQRALSNIESDTIYEYLLDVLTLLEDLKKGRS